MQRKDLFFIDYYHLKTKTACPEGQAVFVVVYFSNVTDLFPMLLPSAKMDTR